MTLPAKRDLSPKQERLVEEIIATGSNPNAVYERCGYATAAGAYKAWRSRAVQERFRELVHERMSLDVAQALLTRHNLLSSRSDFVRMQAVADVLDRAGFKPVEKRMVGLQGNINVSIDLA